MKKVILSLGGSLIVPDSIDGVFLKRFRELILEKLSGFQFVIFAGGGKVCRRYQDAGKEIMPITNRNLDWIGIYASRLNAQLLRSIFAEHAPEEIIIDPSVKMETETPLVFGGGWKPGWSTDFCAVQYAVANGYSRVVNLSNIQYVYDKDPKQFPDAVPIKDISWANFRKLVGDEWKPGLNAPFDPIASKLAQEHNIEVVIADGTNIENVRAILEEQLFTGTLIHN